MLIFVLVLVSIAWIVTLGILMFGPDRNARPGARAESPKRLDSTNAAAPASHVAGLEAELERRRKELDEARQLTNELKGELKQAKRKLYEAREASKEGQDLAKARAEVERGASLQLESVRAELGAALAEIAKLKEEADLSRGRRPQPTPTPAPAPLVEATPAAAPAPRAEPKRVIRELSEAEKERLDRAEHVATKERSRAAELDREVKRLKGRVETQNRVFLVTKGELELIKDKFKALEKRLNRTLLEKDLVQRALKDLATQSGVAAGRTELTADEIAASDKTVEDRMAAEAAQLKASEAKAEAAAAESLADPAAPKTEANGVAHS